MQCIVYDNNRWTYYHINQYDHIYFGISYIATFLDINHVTNVRYFQSDGSHIFCVFDSATVVANHEMSNIRLRIQRRKIFINI